MCTQHAVTSGQAAHVDHVDEEPEDPPIARYIDGHPECPFCCCAPSVTSDNFWQNWWPSRNARPRRLNRPARNTLYKRLWSAMYNRGVWKDPQYVAKTNQSITTRSLIEKLCVTPQRYNAKLCRENSKSLVT